MQRSQRMAALTIAWDGSSDEPLSNDDIRRRGAEFCASQIVQWLMDGATGFAEAGQPLQRLRPADIAVLVRTGKEASAVRRALALGFPVTLAAGAHTTAPNGVLPVDQVVAHHQATLANLGAYGVRTTIAAAADIAF